MGRLVQPAFTIALLGGIESLLSAVVADGMIGSRHRSNMELVAQGVANIASPIFGGIPATGALARTATNVKNGGRTPVAGMVHALFVLLVMLFFGKWAALIPMATLAGDPGGRGVPHERVADVPGRAPLTAERRRWCWSTTFLLTVLVDLTVAVEVGIVLAAFLFMKRMSEVTNVRMITDEMSDDEDPDAEAARARGRQLVVPPGVQVYDVNGPFFFGAAESFKEAMLAGSGGAAPRVLILRMRQVPTIDATGISALRDVIHRSAQGGHRGDPVRGGSRAPGNHGARRPGGGPGTGSLRADLPRGAGAGERAGCATGPGGIATGLMGRLLPQSSRNTFRIPTRAATGERSR